MYLSENNQVNVNEVLKPELGDEGSKVKHFIRTPKSPARTNGLSLLFDDENNDDDERLARRKSRLLEPHPVNTVSPNPHANIVKRRADAAAPRGIPQAQIGEHYGNCIRLAAENKITSKNAFNLHLIDYMSEMIKKDDFASFQIASSSLDAGAKIYAGRVDAVHQETYQVLTGLGRSGKPNRDPNDTSPGRHDTSDCSNGNVEANEIPQAKLDQRRKLVAQRDIIQKQLAKIRNKVLAAKADVDPLFQHQTASFDEGGTAELRLNQLATSNNFCELILDSCTPVMQHSHPTLKTTKSCNVSSDFPPCSTLNIQHITEFLLPLTSQPANQWTLCATLQSFRFIESNQDEPFNFSWEKPNPTDIQFNSPNGLLNTNDENLSNIGDYDNDDNEPLINLSIDKPDPDDHLDETITCDSLVKQEAKNVATSALQSARATLMSNASASEFTSPDSELFVTSLKLMLDKQYEHFGQLNDHLLGMWAGPEHWRKKAKRRKLEFCPHSGDCDADEGEVGEEQCGLTKQTSRKILRSKKEKNSKIIYDEAVMESENRTRSGRLSKREWPKDLLTGLPSTSSTVFKEPYRQKARRQMNMLPSEWVDSRETLYQLIHRKVSLKPTYHPDLRNTQNMNKTDNEPYTFAIANNEFCPVIDCDGIQDDEDIRGQVELIGEDDDDGLEMQLCVNDDDDDDEDNIILPFEDAFTQGATANGDHAYNDDIELIAQPNKVARIEIGYARTAKMINVRRLKSAMWTFLENSIPQSGGGAASQSPLSTLPSGRANSPTCDLINPVDETNKDFNSTSPKDSKVPGSRGFSELIDNLSGRISWQMAKELSISIALNCLLHLSNEKDLYLENTNTLSDIYISQGLPIFELEHLRSFNSKLPMDTNQSSTSHLNTILS